VESDRNILKWSDCKENTPERAKMDGETTLWYFKRGKKGTDGGAYAPPSATSIRLYQTDFQNAGRVL
jgi:hypothetical protein